MNLASSAPGPEYESPARIAVRVIRDKAVLSATVAKGPATSARGSHYPFSTENVAAFAAFLRESGGFSIQ